MMDSLLLTCDRSELRKGKSGLGGGGFFVSLLESFFKILSTLTIDGRFGRI